MERPDSLTPSRVLRCDDELTSIGAGPTSISSSGTSPATPATRLRHADDDPTHPPAVPRNNNDGDEEQNQQQHKQKKKKYRKKKKHSKQPKDNKQLSFEDSADLDGRGSLEEWAREWALEANDLDGKGSPEQGPTEIDGLDGGGNPEQGSWPTESEALVYQITLGAVEEEDETFTEEDVALKHEKDHISASKLVEKRARSSMLQHDLHNEGPPARLAETQGPPALERGSGIFAADHGRENVDVHSGGGLIQPPPGAYAVAGFSMTSPADIESNTSLLDGVENPRDRMPQSRAASAFLVSARLVDPLSIQVPESSGLVAAEARPVKPWRTFALVATLLAIIVSVVTAMAMTVGRSSQLNDLGNDNTTPQIPILPGSVELIGTLEGDNRLHILGASTSLSTNGTVLAIGVPGIGSESGVLAGMVRVYKYDGAEWNQLGDDIAGNQLDLFGWSVDLSADGTIVAAGAVQAVPNGEGHGAVGVYRLVNGTTWTQLGQTLKGDSGKDAFGNSVSLSSDGLTLVASAPFHMSNGLKESGHVRMFRYFEEDGEPEWRQVGQTLHGDAVGDEFGVHVSVSSNASLLVVGANQFRAQTARPGYVRVFELDSQTDMWSQRGSDIVGEGLLDEFGWSAVISADGNVFAAGAPKSSLAGENAGTVSVFRFEQGEWIQIVSTHGREPNDFFGSWVDLSADGTIMVAGAWHAELEEDDPGHMRVFRMLGNGTWFQVGDDILQPHDGASVFNFNEFGINVCVSPDGSTVAMGTLYADREDISDVGQVKVFRMPSFVDK